MLAAERRKHPFQNIDAVAYSMFAVWGGIGGIIIALVLKHADSVLRGFAAAAAAIIATLGSVLLFGFEPSASFAAGAVVVLISMITYAHGAAAPTATARLAIGDDREGASDPVTESDPLRGRSVQ